MKRTFDGHAFFIALCVILIGKLTLAILIRDSPNTEAIINTHNVVSDPHDFPQQKWWNRTCQRQLGFRSLCCGQIIREVREHRDIFAVIEIAIPQLKPG
jgi:hypothetical protein